MTSQWLADNGMQLLHHSPAYVKPLFWQFLNRELPSEAMSGRVHLIA